MTRRETTPACDRLVRRMRPINLKLEDLLARGVPEEITDRERVEATLACSRAIARLDELLAALDRLRLRAGAPQVIRSRRKRVASFPKELLGRPSPARVRHNAGVAAVRSANLGREVVERAPTVARAAVAELSLLETRSSSVCYP